MMKKWNEWTAGEKMIREDVTRAIGEISQGLLDGSIKPLAAGYALEAIRFNMMDDGARQDDYLDAIHHVMSEVSPATAPDMSPERIKAIREQMGLNQFDFAAKLGVSRDAVNSWECGRRKPAAPIRKILELIENGIDPGV